MDFEKLCAERYSLRKYADRAVEAEKLATISRVEQKLVLVPVLKLEIDSCPPLQIPEQLMLLQKNLPLLHQKLESKSLSTPFLTLKLMVNLLVTKHLTF